MLRRILSLTIMVALFAACGQVATNQENAVELNLISDLVSDPMSFEEKEVSFEGIITHTCRHSGDKMRVNQLSDTDFSIMVMLQEFQSQIDAEFEGKTVKVHGILKTVVRNLEELESHNHDHEGEEGHGCSSTEEAIQQMAERGITPDVRAYIEMTSFEIVEPTEVVKEEKGCCDVSKEVIEVAQKASCC